MGSRRNVSTTKKVFNVVQDGLRKDVFSFAFLIAVAMCFVLAYGFGDVSSAYMVTVSCSTGGRVNPSEGWKASGNKMDDRLVSIIPNKGYKVSQIIINNVDIYNNDSTVTGVTINVKDTDVTPGIETVQGNSSQSVLLSDIQTDVTLFVQFEKLEFEVTFLDFDGDVLDRQVVTYNDSALPPEPPEVEGFDFTYWDGDYTNVTSNVIVYSVYKLKTYTVTFVDYDGRVIATRTVEHGTTAIPPDEPKRSGYYEASDSNNNATEEE